MKKYILIKGDTNDGDCISEETEITDEQIEQVRSILKTTGSEWNTRKEYDSPDEWAENLYKDILSHEEIELFNRFVPQGEFGIHTIESVKIIAVLEELL